MKISKIVGLVVGGVVVVVGGLVGYAAATAESRLAFPDTPKPSLVASEDKDVIERGRYLVHGPAHCATCHSTNDRKHPEKIKDSKLQGGLEFAMGPLGTRYARNLTPDKDTGIGNLSDADLARTLRAGVMHDGELSFFMRFAASSLADEDIVAVISYLRSLEPVKNEVPKGEWKIFGKVLLTYAFPPLQPRAAESPKYVPAADEPSVERGEYLVEHVMLCTGCHSVFDESTFEVTGPKAGGSLPDPSHGDDSDMEYVAPNLTSHATGMTGRMDEDGFVTRLKGGRVFPTSIMPWENFGDTTDVDLRSVYRYLHSLPAVDNDVGPTYRRKGWKPGAPE
jgi:mono/diheme cytochrome c family protein